MGHHDLVLFDLDGTLIRSFMRDGRPCPNERCRDGLVWDGESYSEDAGGRLEERCPTCKGKGKLPAEADDYELVEPLPGRLERVAGLREDGTHVAFVTNQGGVAFGYQTVQQVMAKLGRVCEQFDLPYCGGWACARPGLAYTFDGIPIGYEQALQMCPPGVYVSLGHPNAREAGLRVDDEWRKPGGDMIEQAMADYEVTEPSLVLFVGDMDSDRQAAAAAGVEYADAAEYFA